MQPVLCQFQKPHLPHSPVLQVQDEQGRAVPVGFMISSTDTTEVLEEFLRQLLRGVSHSVSQGILSPGQDGVDVVGSTCMLHIC